MNTPSELEIRLTRDFTASREQVYAAMTEPELLKRWLTGPPGWSMTECQIDLRIGGSYSHYWTGPGGNGFSMTGQFHELVPNEKIVRSEVSNFGGNMPECQQYSTLSFQETPTGTRLTLTLRYPTKDLRDAAFASGMQQGMTAAYNAVELLLKQLP